MLARSIMKSEKLLLKVSERSIFIFYTILASFETFGPVRSVDMIYDINTGRHKGFAFVEFETPEAAHLACEDMQGATVGGRSVKVGRTSNMGMAEHFISQFAQEAAR